MAVSVVSSVQKWKEFLTRYYKNKIMELAASEDKTKSLLVDYNDVNKFDVRLAEALLSSPGEVLRHAEDALGLVDLPLKKQITAKIRIVRIPRKTQIRELRSDHINTLISVEGTVRKITDVRPRIMNAAFECARCQNVIYIAQEGTGKFIEPSYCTCNEEKKGVFRLLFKESTFEDYQRVKIQESPEELKGGEQPQTLDISITDDLAGVVTPGERVCINGILRSAQKINRDGKTTYFDIYMDCISTELEEQEFDEVEISQQDEKEIIRLAKDPRIYQKIVRSIAPSIYGYDEVKEAIAHQLFSGVVKNLPDGTRIRGDIHVLLVGDPGIAKSQILRYVVKLAPRGVYTSGKSASSAGLTAAAVKDDIDGHWTLEAGALVLADKGVAAVDEMDKMKNEDRSSLHEAMEQQSYHPLTEVMLTGGEKVSIGRYIDSWMSSTPDLVIQGIDCEILPGTEDISLFSIDMGKIIKLPVDRVSRHNAPDMFIKITYSNGREIVVTPEHPVYVAKDGIACIPASAVKRGDFVPAPRRLPCGVDMPTLKTVGKAHGLEKQVSLPDKLTPELARMLGYLIAEGHFYKGASHEVGFTNKDPALLEDVKSLMTSLFGIGPSVNERHKDVYTLRFISSRLYSWFESNFGNMMLTSRHKRIPSQMFRATEDAIREFLSAAFLGDGCIHSTSLAYSTASKGLAEDYQDLLLMLGISSRIAVDRKANAYKICIMGDSNQRFESVFDDGRFSKFDRMKNITCRATLNNRHHDVLPKYTAKKVLEIKKSLGLTDDGYFNRHFEHDYGITTDVLRSYAGGLRQRYDKIAPSLKDKRSVKEVRETMRWSQQTMAKVAGITRGNVDYIERGGYSIEKRSMMEGIACARANRHVLNAGAELCRLESMLSSELRFLRVTDVTIVPNQGIYKTDYVYDVTIEPTHSFISQGVVLHNTISVAKAGIMATLKCRCSLLGAANPKLGRFDAFDNISEQINMPPSLISRFDLIFILLDKPEETRDANIAGHILKSHYAGELNEQRKNISTSQVSEEQIMEAIKPIRPEIDEKLLRKYIAYARRKIYPIMTDEAKERIINFYLELRKQGEGDNAPIPVTARQLEGLVRLAEASARMRLSDKVTISDVEKTIGIVMTSLRQVGMDKETGKFDIDILTVGVGRSQRERIKDLKHIIEDLAKELGGNVPIEKVVEVAEQHGMKKEKVEKELKKLKEIGEIFEPRAGHVNVS